MVPMSDKPHYLAHRQRLRDRFSRTNGKGLSGYELLELLLTYAIPRRDVKPLAKKLIKKYGSVSGVLDADLKELESFQGLGEVSATLIRLVKEMFVSYAKEEMMRGDALTSPQLVVDFAKTLLAGLPNEVFMVLYLNAKNEVLSFEEISEGTVNKVAVYPRRIVESALKNKSLGIILVHNHPSGYTRPSEEDLALTKAILSAVETVDIKVLDHIVVGKSNYFSFMEMGLLPNVGRRENIR